MFRFLLRLLGFMLLACAVLFAVMDGTKSLGGSGLVLTSLSTILAALLPAALLAVQKAAAILPPAFFWKALVNLYLGLPGFLAVGLLAVLFLALGRQKRRAYV